MAYYMAAGDVKTTGPIAEKPPPLFQYFDNDLMKALDRRLSRDRKSLASWRRINGNVELRLLGPSIDVSSQESSPRRPNSPQMAEVLSNTAPCTPAAVLRSSEPRHGVSGSTLLDKGKGVMESQNAPGYNSVGRIHGTPDAAYDPLFSPETSLPLSQVCPKRLCTDRNREISTSLLGYDHTQRTSTGGSVAWDQSINSDDGPRYDTSEGSRGWCRQQSLIPQEAALARASAVDRFCIGGLGSQYTPVSHTSPISATSWISGKLPDLNLPAQACEEGIIVVEQETTLHNVLSQDAGSNSPSPLISKASEPDRDTLVCRMLTMSQFEAKVLDSPWVYYEGHDPILMTGREFIKEFCGDTQLSSGAMRTVVECFQSLNGPSSRHRSKFAVNNRIFLPPSWVEECLGNHNCGLPRMASIVFNVDVLKFPPEKCRTVVAPALIGGRWICFFFDLDRKKALILNPLCPRMASEEVSNHLLATAGMILQGLAVSFATVGSNVVSPVNQWKYSFVTWEGPTIATCNDGLFAAFFAIIFDGSHTQAHISTRADGWTFRWTLCRQILDSNRNTVPWESICRPPEHE